MDEWAAAVVKSSYLKGADFKESQEFRKDRMRLFLSALISRAENSDDKKALEVLRSCIRGEHAHAMGVSAMVRHQTVLRDVMFDVVEKRLPELPKVRAKLTLDTIVDRSIEMTVSMQEEFMEMRSALARSMPGSPDGSFSVDQSIARFCRSVMDYFGVEFVALFRHVPGSDALVCEACSSLSVALTKDSTVQISSFALAADAISTGKTVMSSEEDGSKKRVIGRLSFKSAVAVPLKRDDTVTGLFLLGDNARTTPLSQDEVSILEDVVAQLSWVLHSSALFQKMTVRTRAQKALIETAASLEQEIESEEIFRIVGTKLCEIVPSDEFAFYVFDWERHLCNPAYATGPYAGEIMADRDFPADIGIVGYVGRTRKAEIILDTEKDPRGNQIPGTPVVTTRMLAVPVIGQKEVIGVIELTRYPPNMFTQDELEIATMFANHASVALENAKLLGELRAARDQIELNMDLLTHDIANYTTPILAYFESLSNRKDLDKQVSSLVNRTLRQAESMARLVEMVRTIARLRERPPKNFRSMDLRKAIEESVEDVRTHAHKDEIQLELELPDEPIMVFADDMLKLIFTHLFYSAALPEKQRKTKLSVTLEPRRDHKMEYWWVKVAQPNRAIPNNLKGAVLKMAKTSKSELTGGFGIGMAAAKGIVDHYSGNMWVSDIVKGDYTKGCVFNIMLPCVR